MAGAFVVDNASAIQGRGYDFGGGGGAEVTTLFGYNYSNSDTSEQTTAGRKARFNNRVPLLREYSSGRMPSSFHLSSSVFEEKRAAYSFKAGGDSAGLAAGDYNADMISWLEGIWTNGYILWTYHHEPNSSGGLEVPLQEYLDTYHQMRLCLDAATLPSGVEVYICANFMGYQLTTNWSDSWVPPPADCDILSFDLYGNPGGGNTSSSGSNQYGGPATGIAYGTTYPDIAARLAPMFDIIDRTGYAASWAMLEINAPARDWDTDEVGRVLWHQDYIDTCMSPPMTGSVPPKAMMIWESPSGVNWDQSWGRLSGDPQPMVDVWYPYITGTPVGGP